jgi:UDP-GlcNAc:undecaprenyl-phosphate GlcNAc-1-phosphate transferase
MVSVAVVLASLLSAWLWNEIFLRFARRLGALSQGIPNQRRWDSRKKPIIGGIAFFFVALGIAAWRPEGYEITRAFLAGGVIAFLTGLADDAFVSVPHMKLIGQIAAATAALLSGAPLLDIGAPLPSIGFTLFWYVAVMNAFNMMDNMDGVAGSIALGLLVGSPWLVAHSPQYFLYLGLVGALVAFLLRNWHPSHLYMGDNGSQFLGFTLAYWGTEVWQGLGKPTPAAPLWEKIVLLVTLFALLAGDTFWVILSRLARRQSPFHGGTDHLTHRLAQAGWRVPYIGFSLGAVQELLTCWVIFMHDTLSPWAHLGVASGIGLLIGSKHFTYIRAGFTPSQAYQKV